MLGIILATIIYVSPIGADTNTGTITQPLKTIQVAINKAIPGDTIFLGQGNYYQDLLITKPLTVTGFDATIRGAGKSHIVDIKSSSVNLNGFTINGNWNESQNAKVSFRDKLIYIDQVLGERRGITNVVISNMKLLNAGGECIRIKNYASGILIANNIIDTCGVWDFRFKDGGKNGEGVYIGTAPEQLHGKSGTSKPEFNHVLRDTPNNILVTANKITTRGNECVDIKEGGYAITVTYNNCSQQLDSESAGMDSRGNRNVFRYNTVHDNVGAAFRFGGDDPIDGLENSAWGNHVYNNKYGVVKVMRSPQWAICGNWGVNNGTRYGKYKTDPQKAC